MRIVFMGTPVFAARILEGLLEHHEIIAAYTRPDAVRGRGKKLVPSPVKQLAQSHHIPVHCPTSFRDPAAVSELAAFEPDLICVASYGIILPPSVLAIPAFGCLNVHASLLPRWRGAAPIQRALLADDEEVGVCIMAMEEGLDTGDYCVCRSIPVGDKDFIGLTDELADLGAQALLTAISALEEGGLVWTPQDPAQASYANKIKKGELFIDPSMPAHQVYLHIQASSPAHPARCVIAGRPLAVLKAREVRDPDLALELAALPRGFVQLLRKRLFLSCSDGFVELLSVRPDGKKTMDALAFAAGVPGIKQGNLSWEGLPA